MEKLGSVGYSQGGKCAGDSISVEEWTERKIKSDEQRKGFGAQTDISHPKFGSEFEMIGSL